MLSDSYSNFPSFSFYIENVSLPVQRDESHGLQNATLARPS
jgi:hypothetical protein